MTSKSFSRDKRFVGGTRHIKAVKTRRIHKDRHLIKQILRQNPLTEALPIIIKRNDGAWELI